MTDEYEAYKAGQASRWLERIRRLGARAETLRMEIDAEREAAAGLRAMRFDGMPRARRADGDAMADAVARIEERVAGYASELSAYLDERAEAHEALASLEDEACRRALTMRYLLGKPWERVCVDMGYTWDGMMKLRRRALSEAYDVMPARHRDPKHPAI